MKCKGEKRRGTNINDIIRLLQEMGEDVPELMYLSRFPPITFDSVDMSVLLNSIKKMENELALLKTVHKVTSMLKHTTSLLNGMLPSVFYGSDHTNSYQCSDVAGVTEDSGKPTPTLSATIVETQTAAVDRSIAGVVASNMDAWHTVSSNRQTRPTPIERRNEQYRKTTCDVSQRCHGKHQRIRT